MGATEVCVSYSDTASKKQFKAKWKAEKVDHDQCGCRHEYDCGGPCGVEWIQYHESFTTGEPLTQKEWAKLEETHLYKDGAKWSGGLCALVWTGRRSRVALKKYLAWLDTDGWEPITTKEELDEYLAWKAGGALKASKPWFMVCCDDKVAEVTLETAKLQAHYSKTSKRKKKAPRCPVMACMASMVPC